MAEFLRTSVAQAVIWTTVLAIFSAFACYGVIKFRGRAVGDNSDTNDLLSNFRDLHHRGTLSEAEFRTIKTMLGAKLRQEIKDTGDEGYDKSK